MKTNIKGTILKNLAIVTLFALGGCTTDYYKETAEAAYFQAKKAYNKGNYEKAAELFAEVDKKHFYSPWAPKAMVMEAYSYFYMSGGNAQLDHYDKAVAVLDAFIQIHSKHPLAPYAMYLKAMCFYVRINEAKRHQMYTEKAISSFEALINKFPHTKYAKDAREKLSFAKRQLSLKEYMLGNTYLEMGDYIGAIKRLQNVVLETSDKGLKEDALAKLALAYVRAGAQGLAIESYNDLKAMNPKHEDLVEVLSEINANEDAFKPVR